MDVRRGNVGLGELPGGSFQSEALGGSTETGSGAQPVALEDDVLDYAPRIRAARLLIAMVGGQSPAITGAQVPKG